MMHSLLDPFTVPAIHRALLAGIVASILCGIAGSWVLIRGLTFLGDAMSHGMLPGIAVATLAGANPMIGAALSAAVMAAGVGVVSRSRRLGGDTAIGLLFVAMLALGVVIISRSGSFTVDVTGILFGDILGVREIDLLVLVVAMLVAVVLAVVGHRAFTVVAFDHRLAVTLGHRPHLVSIAQIGLLTIAVVASFHVVGTLLVFGLLIAPPAAAALWATRVSLMMLGAAVVGSAATAIGLIASWHLETAAGATIALTACALFALSAAASRIARRPSAAPVPTDVPEEIPA